jgi:3'-5' exonuclease
MQVYFDIETIPCADRQPFIEEARNNFKAPSGLTKAQAGADLGLSADEIKFTSAGDLTARWEREMAEKKAPEVAEQAWRKTALDGTKGRVLSIAHKVNGQPNVVIGTDQQEALTIKAFFEMVADDCGDRPPFFIGHNIIFDLKFLFRRSVILGIQPPFELPFKGRHGSDYYCTSQAWCVHGEYISLDNLSIALGLGGKGDFDGSMVCDAWLAGEYDKIRDYNLADVELTEQVHRALTFRRVA